MNSGVTCRNDAISLISLISLIVFAPSVVAIVACIISFTFCNRRRYLVILYSCRTAFVCWSFLLVGITRTFSTLGVGLTLMFSTLLVGITRSVLSSVRFLLVDTVHPFVVSSASIIIHNPLFLHLRLHNITLLLYVIWYPIFVKLTVPLASHNLVTDINECVTNPGILCAHLAYSGRWRQHILSSHVEVIRLPSSSFAVIGSNVWRSSSIGASVNKKWLVAPLSNISYCLIFSKLKSIVFSNEFAACE